MADVNRGNRPLSPHLQIYRPQWTSISSIMVRITGIGCLIASVLVVSWLLAAATSEAAFAAIDGLLRSILGTVILTLAMWGIFYHMLGRLRHVLWDFGYFVQVPVSEDMAKGMFIGATLLTIFVLVVA
ncbi:succinate dehydrogenase, cytochrome b556 subunit [Tateyamaria omphalii]|uniref:succinate dehydrogenase, cytochrome b556 subunit n=1 Tax=Tateyamaria omphalii TaxID=299262 RepID=UPI001C99CC67|nr:succinate dehydrogenase, cytochrome b556 subunit [Tateyamaria omphalii]MBY5933860.1 succinate dehydrogenase, cytochrome b556 subunit [Tateyamaria omphalii]